ncbi:hypothetical protein BGZ80_004161 [Entomortierella chlamydospora]|uniref:Uncharacterized protein n=1 Tax=Entomortierella chlamydospora TaxID=101097 RepID=A0A9P6N0D7_9FUNG|nr:hypothetical protein BGZ80_004161 [Entomortierella chlamydospora]
MAPPKTKPTATVADTANFFKRGKKPTTTNRIITAKKSLATTTAAATQETNNTKSQHDSREYLGSSPKKQGKHSQNATIALIDQNYDEWEGLGTQAFDEIQSDDSWESRDISKHSEYKLFSEVTTPPSTIPAKRAISESKSVTSTLANGREMVRSIDNNILSFVKQGLDPPQDIKDLLLEKNTLNSSLFAGRV